MSVLRAIDRFLARWEARAIVLFLGLMIVFTLAQVLLRALAMRAGLEWAHVVLGHMAWSDAFARALMLWLTFFGASLLTRKNRHIRIDIMSALLPESWAPFREGVLAAAAALVCGVMSAASFRMVRMEMEFGGRLFLDVPAWAVQIILPAGFLLLTFRFALIAMEAVHPSPGEDDP